MIKLASMIAAIAALTGMVAGFWSPPAGIALPRSLQLLSKKTPKPADVVATEVKLTSENIAGTWYYTLAGKVMNRSDAPVGNVVIYYEIYSEAGKIVDAGSIQINPPLIPAQGEGGFQVTPKTTGQVKVTLVRWQKPDRSYASHSQMQVFP